MGNQYNGNHPYKFEWKWGEDIEKIVKKHVLGKSINLCSGSSSVGDIRVDLVDINKYYRDRGLSKSSWCGAPNKFVDVLKTGFGDESFDTVISDPPYMLGKQESVFRSKLRLEMVRMLKPGGVMIYYSFDIPNHSCLSLEHIFLKKNERQPYYRILSISRKHQISLSSFM